MKKFFSKIVLICFISIYFLLLITQGNINNISWFIWIQFIINGVIAISGILKERRDYSLNKMHWYFVLFFMILAPVQNIIMDVTHWGYSFDSDIVVLANFIVFLWEIIYYFIYYTKFKSIVTTGNKTRAVSTFKLNKNEQLAITFISFGATVIMIMQCGFFNLFIRDAASFGEGTFAILFDYLLRSIPPISLVMLLKQNRVYGNVNKILIALLFVLTFILNSPVALSRFWSATVYLGIFISLVPQKWVKGRKIDYLLIIGLLVVFPFFAYFKRYTLSELMVTNIDMNFFQTLSSDDFDAYLLLCKIIEYTQAHGFTLGSQIRSVLLFFIPRAILDVKGYPTGELVFRSYQASFVNVSAPIMGEAYIDFGIVGVVLYAFVFAKLLKKIDTKYWASVNNSIISYYDLMEPFLLGMTIFIMRGALQPAFLRLMGFFLYLIMFYFVRRFMGKFAIKKIS